MMVLLTFPIALSHPLPSLPSSPTFLHSLIYTYLFPPSHPRLPLHPHLNLPTPLAGCVPSTISHSFSPALPSLRAFLFSLTLPSSLPSPCLPFSPLHFSPSHLSYQTSQNFTFFLSSFKPSYIKSLISWLYCFSFFFLFLPHPCFLTILVLFSESSLCYMTVFLNHNLC